MTMLLAGGLCRDLGLHNVALGAVGLWQSELHVCVFAFCLGLGRYGNFSKYLSMALIARPGFSERKSSQGAPRSSKDRAVQV